MEKRYSIDSPTMEYLFYKYKFLPEYDMFSFIEDVLLKDFKTPIVNRMFDYIMCSGNKAPTLKDVQTVAGIWKSLNIETEQQYMELFAQARLIDIRLTNQIHQLKDEIINLERKLLDFQVAFEGFLYMNHEQQRKEERQRIKENRKPRQKKNPANPV